MGRLLGGRYLIERRIGEGGMAEVLLARDEARNGLPVVVKRCRAHLAHQPEMAHLFLREARLASLIHHPNVVELEATGDDDGQPYLVMEYLQGFTVREIFMRSMKEGGVPQDLAAFIVLGAARGLHAAHTAVDEQGVPMGLMHRDISPHNLFVTEAGVVKVLDFGIAKGVNEMTMTRAGHVKGKASYLAPEQLDPNAKMDRRADLFSLGTVSWELFTSRRLFRRATETDTINAIRALKVERPDKVRPEIDVEYADVVMKMLARHATQRPGSAEEVVKSLEKTLARRAPDVGGSALAAYVAHIKEIDPKETSRVSFAPDAPGARERRKDAVAVIPALPRPSPRAPKTTDEPTATVAAPIEAAWISATGKAPPVDGSVVGTFAVAGATSPAADMSGGYEALDPEDLILESSKSEPLPQPEPSSPPAIDEEAETLARAPAVLPPARPEPRTPPKMSPFNQETARIRTRSPIDLFVARVDKQVLRITAWVEGKIGTRPTPPVIAAILFGALFAGATLAFVITSIFL